MHNLQLNIINYRVNPLKHTLTVMDHKRLSEQF